MHIHRRYTIEGRDPFAAFTFVARTSRIVNPDGTVVFEMKTCWRPSTGRRSRSTSWPRSISARPACRPHTEPVAEPGVPAWLAQRARQPGDACTGQETRRPPGVPPAGRLLDLLGLERRLFFQRRATPARFSTRPATCWRRRWRRRTRRSGSTPACTGPTASRARRRAITASIRRRREVVRSTSAYEQPAPHACFIQSITTTW